jgi:methionyl-tRNA formyltransferase
MEEEKKAGGGLGLPQELPSLVFMGTPEFARPSLQMLADAHADIRLVVTQPDRAQGRGRKIAPPPIKVLAQKLEIPVFQPQQVRARDAVDRIGVVNAECLVVVAYGQLLPRELLDRAPLGAINVHASLLPRYRGAAPIQRALMAGEQTTGISIMLLDSGMDTGPILEQQAVAIEDGDTGGSVHDKLAILGAGLLVEALKRWKAGTGTPALQDDARASYAPPIRKEEHRIVWSQEARRIACQIRAFDPWPGAHFQIRGKRIKCFDAALLPWKGDGQAGEVLGLAETGLVVLGGDRQALSIGALQLEGQRRLPADAFVRGHDLPQGTVLE